jgi:nucleoside-triphosphatase THEP1
MAKMYPNYCITDSPGERKLFNFLRESSRSQDWIVLHSLHIARHISKTKGEADFVVLIPAIGIVVIEVKSHQEIKVRQGSWFFGRENTPHESPFKQGETAMYSIRKHLVDQNPIFARIPFLNVSWFTEIDFPKTSQMEYQSWQVLNIADLEDAAGSLLASMEAGVRHLGNKLGISNASGVALNAEVMDEAVRLLRPDFDFAMSEKMFRSERKKELLKFAKDQYIALDIAIDNKVAIIKGAAGTGKSVLAIELARRFQSENLRVALFCFNKLLSDEIAAQLGDTSVYVSTIDSYALKIARLNSMNLPINNLEAVKQINYENLEVAENEKFDVIIIDEAQDVLNQTFRPILEKSLKDGLTSGTWYAFGDLDSQKIYDQTDSIQFVRTEIKEVPVFTLTRNCRNVIQIGHFAEGLLATKPKWNSFLRNENNPDPQLIRIEPDEDMTPILDSVLDQCKAMGFSYDDIAFLSPLEISDPQGIFSESKYASKFVVGNRKPGKISFNNISKFKGLESPCVVLLDLEQLSSWKNRDDLLYVALTRATDRLVILANNSAHAFLTKLLVEGN